jgi:alpha-D-xyloside xylohydrolase
MGLVDFTNPAAVAWYQNALRALIRTGVDCFKTDFGERIPTAVVWHDGSDPMKMHNYYTYLYNKAVFEVLEQEKGKNQALVFARSATAGGQKFPVHWGGDCSATYGSMAETLRGGLSLGLSGFGFWSHDISGFERTATPDLYKRWAAFGLLSSHSRLHGNESYRVPWLFDEEAVDVLRHFVGLKCRLMPHLWSQAHDTVTGGLPMARAMALEFPDDPGTAGLDRQYLLGDSLLVAPVFRDDGEVTYYVPAGRWTRFLEGGTVDGPGWRTERHDYFHLPFLVRPHSVIAVGNNAEKPDYDFADGVTFEVFEPEPGRVLEAIVRGLDSTVVRSVRILSTGNTLEAVVTDAGGPRGPWKLLVRGLPAFKSVRGGAAEAGPLGVSVRAAGSTVALEW